MNARDLFLSPGGLSREALDFLGQAGLRDSEAAKRGIQQIAELGDNPLLVASIAEELLASLADSADPDAALRGFAAFLESVPSLSQFVYLAQENPAILEVVATITGGSEFLTLLLLRNPRYIYWLMEPGNLERIRDSAYFQNEAARVLRIGTDVQTRMDALQRFQRREMLRIGTQDLLRTVGMPGIAAQVSFLADAVLQTALDITAAGRDDLPAGFVVLGLGKLGGRELNFSSDVDLLFLYQDEKDSRRMLKFARAYRKNLTEDAPEGHLYRVDLRLRPMGNRGEIAVSLAAADNYYRHWADTTDRIAMIKARPVAGNLKMGEEFLAILQSFVYKRYLDFAAVEEIRILKQRTDRELKQKEELLQNIKLGLGGIREIEFFVQSFQLLYGGLNPGIRSGNTLEALDSLLDQGLIERDDHSFLSYAYKFLRDLEHKLQLVSCLQTQSLPEDEDSLYFCARRLGYRSPSCLPAAEAVHVIVESFSVDLQKITKGVNKIFSSLFQDEPQHGGLAEILLDRDISDEEALDRIREKYSPLNPEGVLEGIRILENARSYPHSPQKMRNLLVNLLPFLLEKSSELRDPRELFTRLDRFADSLGGRVSLYSEMAGDRSQAERLLDLLASGPFLAEGLIKRPELADYVLSTRFPEPDYPASLEESLRISTSRGRDFKDSLRFFKQSEEFKLGVEELSAPGSAETRRKLSFLAEVCLVRTVREVLGDLSALENFPFSIAALGKLGGRELIFHSDLDLVFVYDDSFQGEIDLAILQYFIREVKNILQEYTGYGKAYSLDFRLRPEGRTSTDVISLRQLEKYFQDRAEPWERLAYVKIRTILDRGCPLPFPSLLGERSLTSSEVEELMRIRLRKERELTREKSTGDRDFKIGYGGILDTQFYVQMLQLKSNIWEPGINPAVELLASNKVISPEIARDVNEIIRFLFALESSSDLSSPTGEGGSILCSDSPHTQDIARLLNFSSSGELLEKYDELAEKNRGILNSVVDQW